MMHNKNQRNWLWAILSGRCPRCRQGNIFATFWRTHEDCPVCKLHYEREAGFFLMSIFIAYFLDSVVLVPLGISLFRSDLPILTSIIVGLITLIIITPFSYRYSRILWLHIDWGLDPQYQQTSETIE